jgi:hypothetical protein
MEWKRRGRGPAGPPPDADEAETVLENYLVAEAAAAAQTEAAAAAVAQTELTAEQREMVAVLATLKEELAMLPPGSAHYREVDGTVRAAQGRLSALSVFL